MGIRSLGYLRIESPDLEGWRNFAGNFLGTMPVGVDDDVLRYRMDRYPARLVVARGAEPKMTAMGYEVLNARDLDKMVAAVEASGAKVTFGTDAEADERRVNGFVGFDDPAGNPVELFYGPVLDHVPVHTPLVNSFVTGDQGMGHVIVTGEDGDALFDFYTRVLGFLERNTKKGGGGRTTYFLGCNPRHHTLGVTSAPGPGRLVHLMVEVADLDDVGLAIDRAEKYNVPMMSSLGKHTNDHMVSFYVYSPEQYAIEFGYSGLRVPEEESTYEITAGAFWGHKYYPPPSD
jgi:3,4-dihydroxy-9,10-secoandrosta-1,3,5(10)-triene-9,17-dione 4,5-dioxygenase